MYNNRNSRQGERSGSRGSSARSGRGSSGRTNRSSTSSRRTKSERARKNRRIRTAFFITLFIIGFLLGFLIAKKIYNKKNAASVNTPKSGVSTDNGGKTANNEGADQNAGYVKDAAVETGEDDQGSDPAGTKRAGIKVICLDAGHGFKDAGTFSDYIPCYEKDITLDVTLKLKKELESKGYQVVMTHDGQSFPPVGEITLKADNLGISYQASQLHDDNIFSAYERTIYSNILNADYSFDFFLSVHVNSFEQESVSGFRIDYCSENDYSSKSAEYSEKIRDSLAADFPDTKMKFSPDAWDDAFIVTKHSQMPSMLLEIGYCTNKTDAENMMDDAWRNKLVKSVAGAL